MDTDHLQNFLLLAQSCNMTRTAERVHLTQPALSGQIRRLEQGLQATLFHRQGRGLALTQAGGSLPPLRRRCPRPAQRRARGARLARHPRQRRHRDRRRRHQHDLHPARDHRRLPCPPPRHPLRHPRGDLAHHRHRRARRRARPRPGHPAAAGEHRWRAAGRRRLGGRRAGAAGAARASPAAAADLPLARPAQPAADRLRERFGGAPAARPPAQRP